MGSRIVSIAPTAEAAALGAAFLSEPEQADVGQHVWRGASGKGYAHKVYSLIECPPLPKAIYILVRRDQRGQRQTLHIGLAQSETPTLNLAQVRQKGAQLGANEVHVHTLAHTDATRLLVACDLRAGQFGALGSEPACARA
jgi:hypothetical protein